MRRRVSIVLAIVLILGFGASAGLADSGARPFKGRVYDSFLWNTATSGDPGGPAGLPRTAFQVEGPIHATHLGLGTYTSVGWIDHPNGWWDTAPPIYCASLVPGTTTVTFVAANGDELYGSLEGGFCMNVDTGYGWGTFSGPLTGGTGRFEDAEGTITKEWTGLQGPTGAVVDSVWTGVIGY
jgi:hypothetical protein